MTETKPEYHVASFSGGKDSTAMVLHMIERGDHLDEVIFCDTTMEFPAMLRHVEKVKKVIEAAGIKFTTLRAENDFEYQLTQKHLPNRKPTSRHYGVPGRGWGSFKNRWCTKYLKTDIIDEYLENLRERYDIIQYIGIAADEDYRLEKEHNQDANHRHPLRVWGWVEDYALSYCYGKGYDWEGLYEIFKNEKTGRARVSCWCCPLQNYDSLRVLRRKFPALWDYLLELDAKQWQTYAHGFTVEEIDKRFALEDALTEAGESITNRPFHRDLKRLLAGEVSIDDIIEERQKEVEI